MFEACSHELLCSTSNSLVRRFLKSITLLLTVICLKLFDPLLLKALYFLYLLTEIKVFAGHLCWARLRSRVSYHLDIGRSTHSYRY